MLIFCYAHREAARRSTEWCCRPGRLDMVHNLMVERLV